MTNGENPEMGYLKLITLTRIYRRMVLGGSVQLSGTMTENFWQHRVGREVRLE